MKDLDGNLLYIILISVFVTDYFPPLLFELIMREFKGSGQFLNFEYLDLK